MNPIIWCALFAYMTTLHLLTYIGTLYGWLLLRTTGLLEISSEGIHMYVLARCLSRWLFMCLRRCAALGAFWTHIDRTESCPCGWIGEDVGRGQGIDYLTFFHYFFIIQNGLWTVFSGVKLKPERCMVFVMHFFCPEGFLRRGREVVVAIFTFMNIDAWMIWSKTLPWRMIKLTLRCTPSLLQATDFMQLVWTQPAQQMNFNMPKPFLVRYQGSGALTGCSITHAEPDGRWPRMPITQLPSSETAANTPKMYCMKSDAVGRVQAPLLYLNWNTVRWLLVG